MPKAHYRRSDSRWQTWWPILVTIFAYFVGGVGIYVGMSNQLAVARVEIANLQRSTDGAKQDLKERIISLEANMRGLETYVVQLHQNERKETR